jgi:hypothetical protein
MARSAGRPWAEEAGPRHDRVFRFVTLGLRRAGIGIRRSWTPRPGATIAEEPARGRSAERRAPTRRRRSGARRAACAVSRDATPRRAGIPAAVGLADVGNHLNTEKLRRALGGTDVLHDHGYAALWLDGRWVKAAAVFNRGLCARFGVQPTEFDGIGDALLQEYDATRRRHMAYLRDDGLYDDLPLGTVIADFRAH